MASPVATLYYGFYLGCPDDGGWLVAEADEYGTLSTAGRLWLAAAEDEDDYPDHMRMAILLGMGVDAADVPTSDLDEVLAERFGVQVVDHGSLSNGIMHYGLALPGTIHRADDYTPKPIAPSVGGRSHEPLHNALRALNVSPNQANPSWILSPGDS